MELERYDRPAGAASAAQRVARHLCAMFESGQFRPGDRLPSERDLAQMIGVSRPSLRAGLQSLAAMGLISSRRGSGTYVAGGPPALGGTPLQLMASWRGVSWRDLFEARAMLEVDVAGWAAERATPEQLAAIAAEVNALLAATKDAAAFLDHDARFHQRVAEASGNTVVAAMAEMLSGLFYEVRRRTPAQPGDLEYAARLHSEIHLALEARDAARARRAMVHHLEHARMEYELEEQPVRMGDALEDH